MKPLANHEARRVLVAEDERVSRTILARALVKSGYEVELAKDGNEALAALERDDAPKLALVNWTMPGMDGVEICRRIRTRSIDEAPYIYMVMLTAKDHVDDLVKAMAAGVDDYLTKPFDISELRARLMAGERVLQLQASLLLAQERLRIQATHDQLTGLLNRAAIIEMLDKELARCARHETSVAVLLADIDHFKSVNDTYGHSAGDSVLRDVTARLKSSVRPYDGLGRYGGEEFLIVLPNCDARGAAQAAARIRGAVAAHTIPCDGGAVSATLSIGYTTSADVRRAAAEKLIGAADRALYRAKRAGRNCAELATDEELALATAPFSRRVTN